MANLSPVTSLEGEVVNLTKVTRSEMGAYLCIAANGVPPSVSKRIMLHVHSTSRGRAGHVSNWEIFVLSRIISGARPASRMRGRRRSLRRGGTLLCPFETLSSC
ncbi:hypothetical protein EVAR_86748_1 [Eumeta japonica]|uniref:Lachesin n=1 Tax=Eumeta variegata TaxID=151549 RepID=A0A4C1W379_EUMVA|nr:hypothetical protein EVAR_86748_1 [Eumeta japonica]